MKDHGLRFAYRCSLPPCRCQRSGIFISTHEKRRGYPFYAPPATANRPSGMTVFTSQVGSKRDQLRISGSALLQKYIKNIISYRKIPVNTSHQEGCSQENHQVDQICCQGAEILFILFQFCDFLLDLCTDHEYLGTFCCSQSTYGLYIFVGCCIIISHWQMLVNIMPGRTQRGRLTG